MDLTVHEELEKALITFTHAHRYVRAASQSDSMYADVLTEMDAKIHDIICQLEAIYQHNGGKI